MIRLPANTLYLPPFKHLEDAKNDFSMKSVNRGLNRLHFKLQRVLHHAWCIIVLGGCIKVHNEKLKFLKTCIAWPFKYSRNILGVGTVLKGSNTDLKNIQLKEFTCSKSRLAAQTAAGVSRVDTVCTKSSLLSLSLTNKHTAARAHAFCSA